MKKLTLVTSRTTTSKVLHGAVISTLVLSALVCTAVITAYNTPSASALTYQSTINPAFTINPTPTVSLSSSNLIINNLSPTTASDSNIITITTTSNNSTGYVLGATVGDATNYNTTNLIYNNTNNTGDPITDSFTSLTTSDNITTLTDLTPGKWGYAFSSDNNTTWSNYSGLPLYTTDAPKELASTTTPATTATNFKIAAAAKDTQMAGEYNNVINFIATANPVPGENPGPVTTKPGCISYNTAVVGVNDTMDDDCNSGPTGSGYANNATANLWASNFQRPGYGFAGWSDKYDWKLNQNDENGNGTGYNQGYHIYGPNATITTPDNMTDEGFSLYAVWVPSQGSLQSWTGCSAMTTGQVTALTDERDNQTYAIAKLADNNCWMIENLRLDNQYTTGDTNKALAQGYGTSTTYGNFSGLAEPETSGFRDTYSANSLYSNDGSNNTINIGTSNGPAYRMPRYNNQNTANPATNMTGWNNNANTYSVGNWYTWAAAIADTSYYNTNNQTISNTSICPTGWKLPAGGNKNNTTNSDFWKLSVAAIGAEPANTSSQTQPYYTGSTEGTNASNTLRSYPNNFIYSGSFNYSSPNSRGSYGYYWSSSVTSIYNSYNLYLDSSFVYPGTINDRYFSKYNGFSVRCLSGS